MQELAHFEAAALSFVGRLSMNGSCRFRLAQWKATKLAQALAVQPMFSQGMIYAPARDWAEQVITEMSMFPVCGWSASQDFCIKRLSRSRCQDIAAPEGNGARWWVRPRDPLPPVGHAMSATRYAVTMLRYAKTGAAQASFDRDLRYPVVGIAW
jgi:hypothetical protein